MYEGSDYVLSIYGTKLDPNTPFAQQQKRMREPRNSIAEGNQYGSDSIIAVFPRNNAIIYQNIIDRTGQFPKIPSKYIMASVIGGRESISSQYIQALESGELTPKLTTTDIGRRTVPKATTPDKISVAETFEEWKKRMIEMEILK